MSTLNLDLDAILGAEALTLGERVTSFFKELSLGIDSFNAKHLNKSIHTLNGGEIWKQLALQNKYFNVSIKHIPSPVFFNANKISFVDYVQLILKAVPILKLLDTQADNAYRAMKTCAATGKLPHTIRNVDNLVLINETKELVDNLTENTGIHTRALSEFYPSFSVADGTVQRFNDIVKTLSSRDVEVTVKNVNMVMDIAKLLKRKIDSKDVELGEIEMTMLNDATNELITNVTFTGKLIGMLSELTRVMQLQIDDAKKL